MNSKEGDTDSGIRQRGELKYKGNKNYKLMMKIDKLFDIVFGCGSNCVANLSCFL